MRDKLGIFFSGLCVVHCMLSAFLLLGGVGSASMLSISEEFVHPILLIFVVIIGLISFPSAYKQHEKPHPIIFGVIGTIGLFIALFFDTNVEIILTIGFGTMLILAHFWNHKLGTN